MSPSRTNTLFPTLAWPRARRRPPPGSSTVATAPSIATTVPTCSGLAGSRARNRMYGLLDMGFHLQDLMQGRPLAHLHLRAAHNAQLRAIVAHVPQHLA